MDANFIYHENVVIESYVFILQPASQQIELEVEYAPEVEAQEIFVHAKSGKLIE